MTWVEIQRPVTGSVIGASQCGIPRLHVGLLLERHRRPGPDERERVRVVDGTRYSKCVPPGMKMFGISAAAAASRLVVLVGVLEDALVAEAELPLVDLDLQVLRARSRSSARLASDQLLCSHSKCTGSMLFSAACSQLQSSGASTIWAKPFL